ncbi:M23 family metallopeptidase [Hyphococcus luteus]|uniref:M23ase beta-sheet core domain-containing protein n=1 Tax=Hyphococcus luteus TaxID=2058213 RepID=A0A2S7K3K3_9PROT|nr:M23 family metallopeptidase [Marinicaulis flavus]PQA87082.1 hypothetical protein CW354_13620 [Marinicaulis flavus]
MKTAFAALIALAFAAPAVAQDAKNTDQVEEAENLLPPAGSKVGNISGDDGKASLARRANYAEAMNEVAERQKVFAGEPVHFTLDGSFAQGGLLFGQTEIGATAKLDGDEVMVDDDGRFILGFGRDAAPTALLVVTLPDGTVERRAIEIEDREFPTQRIDGLDQSKVSGFTEEQLAKIAKDSALKKAARQETQRIADWSVGFDWPVTGRISGVFGSQRILNGEPKRPHSGLDIAAPAGTPIHAPAPGIVRLAETGMYFEGGLVLLDHGHWLESAFLHMSRIDVEPGQRVEKGDVIGAVGATGRATGPHLHWSIKWKGMLVDPQLTLDPLEPVKAAASAGK